MHPKEVSTTRNHDRRQIDAIWGIYPPWSESLISVAEGEKVNIAKRLPGSLESYRCLIPIDCWHQYAGKLQDHKYRFQASDGEPLLMAGDSFAGAKKPQQSLYYSSKSRRGEDS